MHDQATITPSNNGGGYLHPLGITVRDRHSTFNEQYRGRSTAAACYIDIGRRPHHPVVVIQLDVLGQPRRGPRRRHRQQQRPTSPSSSCTITLNTAASDRGSGIWTSTAPRPDRDQSQHHLGQRRSTTSSSSRRHGTSSSSLGYNFVGAGNAARQFQSNGRQAEHHQSDARPLAVTGGQTETHRPLRAAAP